ncbi:hypothetical protein L484_009190 [Morus notabilis]|uniref:Uncharacterized protein n=1 Tax=Morus notabilis TaxID=981085 RepID=W9SGH1_9ROSA|nr:hypothetical protein L484_009190 [Morus notabilis]
MAIAVTPNYHIASIISGAFYGLWNLFSGFIIPLSRQVCLGVFVRAMTELRDKNIIINNHSKQDAAFLGHNKAKNEGATTKGACLLQIPLEK